MRIFTENATFSVISNQKDTQYMACEAIKDMVNNGVHTFALFEDTLQIDNVDAW